MTRVPRPDGEPAGHVHATLDDPVLAALSGSIGGPVGPRAGRRGRWWNPVRVLVALTALCFAVGMVSKSPCAVDSWSSDAVSSSRLCGSDLADDYVGDGYLELAWPWSGDEATRQRYAITDEPAFVGLWSWSAAWVTHVLAGSPDLSSRYQQPSATLADDPGVRREVVLFVAVNAVGLALLALLAVAALSRVHRRRPWDALAFAAAPVLALSGLVGWDLLAAAAVAGALWAWTRAQPVLAGVLLGLGAAAGVWPVLVLPALLGVAVRRRRADDVLPVGVTALGVWALANAPAFLTGRAQWERFWVSFVGGGPDEGSLWTILDGGLGLATSTVAVWSWTLVGVWLVGVLVLSMRARVTPRVSQVAFLLVAGLLLLGATYESEQALWLLPLAVLARPRWRDQLVWQGGEAVYFAMAWWNQGGYLAPGGGGEPGFGWLAIVLRLGCTLYLVAVVARDVWCPEHDPVVEERSQSRVIRSNDVAV